MSKIYLESLDKKRQEVFQTLSVFKKTGYLAGGTALALQISHRSSEDFDIFITKAVDNALRLNVEKVFGHVRFYIDTSDQISFKTKEYVDVFFLLKNGYIDLNKIISMANKKFKGEFVSTQFLEQLRYFDDIKTVPIEFVEKKYTDDEIKSYLQQSVEDYLKKILLTGCNLRASC